MATKFEQYSVNPGAFELEFPFDLPENQRPSQIQFILGGSPEILIFDIFEKDDGQRRPIVSFPNGARPFDVTRHFLSNPYPFAQSLLVFFSGTNGSIRTLPLQIGAKHEVIEIQPVPPSPIG